MDDNARKAQEERMTSDLGLQLVTEEKMVCKNCKHSEGDILSCGIYEKKPEGVLDGGECKYLE